MKTGEKLRVVLDTNVLLNAMSPKLPYRAVLQYLLSGRYELCLTTEILLEYEEKITEFYSPPTAAALLDAFAISSHVRKTEVFFRFNLIKDMEDNKFLDCAFASNAHYLVSDDKDFHVLKNLVFPKIEWVRLDEFCKLLLPHDV